MAPQKYFVNQHLIETVLAWVRAGEIAIPEIQRPFVWDASKVRDLLDSLYQGYPIGYLIAWRNHNIKLKDGRLSEGKKILIDGQQRVTALTASLLGEQVVDQDYCRVRIQIAFHPIDERFEVLNPAIRKDSAWIPDVAEILSGEVGLIKLVRQYCQVNSGSDEGAVEHCLERLRSIPKKQIGLIELDADLDIETVTEIFIRINSKGVVLSQADFAMSKIAANESYGGSTLRKCIDYFCHLAVAPEFYPQIQDGDRAFTQTEYFPKIAWLKDEIDDLYDPDYSDLLRVAFTSEFNRGKLSDLVSLLSGRNFEKKTYEEEIAKASFDLLRTGVLKFVNETNFKRFVMIIKSAGFVTTDLVRSQNALNFAYIVYLKLKSLNYAPSDIESYVRRWFAFSILTGRYSGSPESRFDFDIKNISGKSFPEYLQSLEDADLSSAFWEAALVQNLNTSVASSPYFNVFLAAQVKAGDKGFLSRDITVNHLIVHRGDIHHIFPKDYLKKAGKKKGDYNQVANYVYTQSEINIQIGNKPPKEYLGDVKAQCASGPVKYGGIRDLHELQTNLARHCIPEAASYLDLESYPEFLQARRKLMAEKVRDYYRQL
ncbi:MAG: DUF262 domain-containing protein [Nitrospira sp.]|nr:DUF262 domain-containing protein [Nitrospira sp.]